MFSSVNQSRRSFIGGALLTLSSADAQFRRTSPASEGSFPSLACATTWINSPALSPAALRGRVVLVNFCTYSCINWLRSLPYVRAWADRYRTHGLEVIGVHSPEFEFEKDVENVRRAVRELRIDYPVAVDSDHAVWRAFGNQYWPAVYLIDAQGRIRHRHFGEGEYERSERILRDLLSETGWGGVDGPPITPAALGAEAAADGNNLNSAETYLGYERTRNFASPGGAARNMRRLYTAPAHLRLNHWGLSGDWAVKKNSVLLSKPGGRIFFRFHARDLHLVMGTGMRGAALPFRVRIDGKPPADAHGIDTDSEGNGKVVWPRLHQLIRQPGPIRDRQFQIEFPDAAAEAFSFTFG
jgi:thiol-disulfide isomerase/thioredoxin